MNSGLKERSSRKSLVEKNIIKESQVAPALSRASSDLNAAMKNDTIDKHVITLPYFCIYFLFKKIIDFYSIFNDNKKIKNKNCIKLQRRPSKKDMIEKKLLPSGNLTVEQEKAKKDLQLTLRQDSLKKLLERRPSIEEVQEKGLMNDN